jgi:hypothetical protein
VAEMVWLAFGANKNLFLVTIIFDPFLVVDTAQIFVLILFCTSSHKKMHIFLHIFLLL